MTRTPLMAVLASAFAVLASTPAWSADLMQIYQEALANDAKYAAARASLEAGREKLPQGQAGLLPTVGVTGNTTWNRSDSQDVERQFNSHGYTLTLSQPVFRWQNWVAYGQAEWQVAQAEAEFVRAQQDLVLRVAQAYFDVLNAQENLRAIEAQKTAITQQLELAKKSFEVGTATITDTHEAQSRFDLATAQAIAAASDLEIRNRTLQSIIGKEPGALARLRNGAVLSAPQPASMQDWVDAAEKDSAAVRVQQALTEVARREIERNRAGHFPTLDVVATHGRTPGGTNQLGVLPNIEQTTIGLQMNLPIFAGGAVSSREREAAANRDAAVAALENARRTAALDARQAYLGVVNGLAQVKALEAASVSSQSALESNKLGYEVGVRINIDVLNAEQQFYSTQRDLAKARFDTLLAQLRLKAAVGTLAEDDIKQVNALLAP